MKLTFSVLNALFDLPADQVSSALEKSGRLEITDLGSAIEYCFRRGQAGFQALPLLSQTSDCPVADQIERVVASSAGVATSLSVAPEVFEIAQMPQPLGGNAMWSAFLRRMVAAATRAGFGKESASGFVSGFRELVGNAEEHSDAPKTVVVAYRWEDGVFEMVVADAGIGVRDSLKKNSKYSAVSDHAVALAKAIQPGISSKPESGRGLGFRSFFECVAGYAGHVRLRSGTAGLVLDGEKLVVVNHAILHLTHHQGFLAAITCRT